MIWSLGSKKFRRTLAVVAGAAMLMMTWPMMVWGQIKPDEQRKPADPPRTSIRATRRPSANDALAEQVQQLREKVAKLEAALSQGQETGQSSPKNPGQGTGRGAAAGDTGVGQGGRASAKFQNCIQCHQTRPSGPLPASHLEKAGGVDLGAVNSLPRLGREGRPSPMNSANPLTPPRTSIRATRTPRRTTRSLNRSSNCGRWSRRSKPPCHKGRKPANRARGTLIKERARARRPGRRAWAKTAVSPPNFRTASSATRHVRAALCPRAT